MLSRRTESSRIVLFVVDQLLLGAALVAAFWVHAQVFADGVGKPPRAQAALLFTTLPLLALGLSASGMYRLAIERNDPRLTRSWDILFGGMLALAALLAAELALSRVTAMGPLDRGVAFLFAGLASLGLLTSRTLLGVANRRLGRGRDAGARVVIIGSSTRVLRLLAAFQRAPQMHLNVVGMVADNVPADVAPRVTLDEAVGMLEQGRVDHVIMESTEVPRAQLDEIMQLADREGVSVHITSPIFPSTNLVPTWERVGGVPVLGFVTAELSLGARMAKRGFDVVVGGIMLIVLAVPMMLIGLAVKLTSRGPAFYVQERVGQGGHSFPMFKFRSMRLDAEDRSGPVWAEQDDPRCTPLGNLLRKTNLDELPQLFNVLMGHMSLVGPRPERPQFVQGFKRKIPRYAHKHWVKPGITGWAQVHGLRGNTSLKDRVEHDLYYIENWSLLLDIRILVRTLFDRYLNSTA